MLYCVSSTIVFPMKSPLVLIVFFAACLSQADEMIPFSMPWYGAPNGVLDLRASLEIPAGGKGRVQVRDGHYYAGEQRIRFYGVNIVSAACFPTAENAKRVADRIARCGFNVVRFHHMDSNWDDGLIDYSDGTSTKLNPVQLDRLDRFVAELKAVGVYSNLNLLCSRVFKGADGLHPDIDKMDWKECHVIGFFDEGARNLQKAYAQDLLLHVNPYTGLSYAQDPAVAIVEINNEDGLIQQWYSGVLDSIPTFYKRLLRVRWNAWLGQKYLDSETLLTAWSVVDEPLGSELLDLLGGSSEGNSWVLETHELASASLRSIQSNAANSGVRITLEQPGTEGWHVQLNHPGLMVESEQVYTLSFEARSDRSRNLSLSMMQAHDPWQSLGFSKTLSVGTSWQTYEFTFNLSNNDANARLNFGDLGLMSGWLEIAGVSLRTGGKIGGFNEGESLELHNIHVVSREESHTSETLRDWLTFLRELETNYWSDMDAFIRALGFEGLTWGTTIMTSSPHTQSGFASTDSHAYWQHPVFPVTDWDPVNWTVDNVSMVNDSSGGIISDLAFQRVKGKPHNVTEYQHPSPNTFSSEGPLFASVYGSFQDWDGIYFFDYGSSRDDWNRSTFNGFFDIDRHPSKLLNAMVGSLIFRHFMIQPGVEVYCAPFDAETEMDVLLRHGNAWNVADGRHLDLSDTLPLRHRFQLDLQPLPDVNNVTAIDDSANEESGMVTSDTGEIIWNLSVADAGIIIVNSPFAKGVWGFTSGRTWNLNGIGFSVAKTRQDWGSIMMMFTRGQGFSNLTGGGSGVIITTGDIENSGMIWTDASRTSVGDQWGQGPTLVENISASITLPVNASRVHVWALNAGGERIAAVPVVNSENGSRVQLGGETGSIWYEFEILSE